MIVLAAAWKSAGEMEVFKVWSAFMTLAVIDTVPAPMLLDAVALRYLFMAAIGDKQKGRNRKYPSD